MKKRNRSILKRAAAQILKRKATVYDVTPAKALEFMYVESPSYMFNQRSFDQWLKEVCGVHDKSELGV
jgi:hypothetical protein